jgi:gluconolactonase
METITLISTPMKTSPLYACLFFLFTSTIVGQKTIGSVERLDPEINRLIPGNAVIEILADGFSWSEGPVWVPELKAVLFTDVPQNKAYRWDEANGLQVYLDPSGYTAYAPNEKKSGANGLILDPKGNLLLAQHGDRRIAKMLAPLETKSSFITLVDSFGGKRFHSPNDLILSSNGDLLFTDPPYGLNGDEDPLREIKFNGVYRHSSEGETTLLYSGLTRPNGLAFSRDESILYIANSDPKKNLWMAFDYKDGALENPRVFFDATAFKQPGLADGLKVHSSGAVFATGPGGVLIFSAQGKHLGTIRTPGRAANCAFDEDETYLYITANKYLTRIKLN